MAMREKLIELIHDARMNAFWHRAKDPIKYIADMLIANGVTIPVRCKDCRFCIDHPTSDKVKLCTNEEWNTQYYPFAKEDGFCSYGERKGDGNG